MSNTNTHEDPDIARTLELNQSSSRMKSVKRWLGWAALVLAIAVAVILWGARGNNDTVQYKTEAALKGNLTVTVTATGNLEPTNEVEVGIEVSGTIKTVEVDYNDSVKVGQVLARLDTTRFEAQVLQSKSALAVTEAKVLQAQATAKEAHNELARLQKAHELSGGKVPSQHDLDAAEATLKRARADEVSARASVSQAQATLELNQTDLTKAVIYSPVDGIVLVRDVEPGQTVASSFQAPVLFTLAEDLSQMELHVDVDEADVGQVKAGQAATFTVDAYPDRNFPAHITQVRYGSQTVDGVVTYETVLNVDNTDLSLRPGMTATADITVKKVENVLLVPNAALRFSPPVQKKESSSDGLISQLTRRGPPRAPPKKRTESEPDKNRQQLWVLRDGQPEAVAVTVGARDGTRAEVLEGDIEPGMALVIESLSRTR